MYEFLDRLVSIALPRIRDFKGIADKFDGSGNYTLGVTEQIIFPEIVMDKVTKMNGYNITFVTTAKNDEEGYALLKKFWFTVQERKKELKVMAKESMKAREVKRAKLVERFAEKRARLKAEGDYIGMSLLPKNSAKIRLHNRCKLTGRPKGYMRQFGISRIQFREMASSGLIPGVKKASW